MDMKNLPTFAERLIYAMNAAGMTQGRLRARGRNGSADDLAFSIG